MTYKILSLLELELLRVSRKEAELQNFEEVC